MKKGARRRPRSFDNKKANSLSPSSDLAEWTGLEPATPGVTGRYSNQLNYHSKILLTTYHDCLETFATVHLVGAERLELPTYAL